MRRRQRAQSLVEFALVAPLLFLLVFGTIDLGRAVFTFTTISEAAELGARAVVPGLGAAFPKPTNAQVISTVRSRSGGLVLTAVDPSHCNAATDTQRPQPGTGWIYINPMPPAGICDDVNTLGHQEVRVTVRYTFMPATPPFVQLFRNGFVLTAWAVYTTEQ